MRKLIKNLAVLLIVALSIFSFFYINDAKTQLQFPAFSQTEVQYNQYSGDEREGNRLPESKVVRFFVDRALAMLNPVLNKN